MYSKVLVSHFCAVSDAAPEVTSLFIEEIPVAWQGVPTMNRINEFDTNGDLVTLLRKGEHWYIVGFLRGHPIHRSAVMSKVVKDLNEMLNTMPSLEDALLWSNAVNALNSLVLKFMNWEN